MDAFRALVKKKGWTIEEVRDLLRDGVMSYDPPSFGSVRNWIANASDPRAPRLVAIETFNSTFSPKGNPK
jgi:hypothetical protein